MQTVQVSRFRVPATRIGEFEAAIKEQSAVLRQAGPGIVLYAVVRRGEDRPDMPALLSRPLPGTEDYIELAAARAGSGSAALISAAAPGRAVLESITGRATEMEVIESPAFVAGVSRDLDWSPETIETVRLFRMRLKPDEALLEKGALRMMRSVADREPDPPLYTITKRRPGGSTLLPAGIAGQAEYIRFHVYQQRSGLETHVQLDKEWWGAFYPQFLLTPLESLGAARQDVVTGFTRAHVWGAADTYEQP